MTKNMAKHGLISVASLSALITTVILTTLPLATPPRIVRVYVTAHVENTPQQNKELAQRIAGAYGWRGKEWTCLRTLWSKESAFRHRLPNKQGSSAYGIAQMLNEKSTIPAVQIVRGMKYIEKRYRTPCRSLAFFQRHNYY